MSQKKFNDKTLVLFDLDGTLVDSVPDIAFSIDQMMIGLDQPPCGESQVREYVGNGAKRLIERALTGEMDAKPDVDQYQQAERLFFEHYAANVCRKSTLYPGTFDALQVLQDAEFTFACVTNKPSQFTQPLLEAVGIDRFFTLVLSGDSLPRKKPDPLPLVVATEKMNRSIEAAVMVGDSTNDILAAKSAAMDCISVSYGYNHGADISLSRPDAVIDSMEQLPSLLCHA